MAKLSSLLLLVLAVILLGCDSHKAAVSEDVATNAAKARDAIIDLVRTKQVEFCWEHANAEEMAKLPLEKFDEGQYYFGPFHMNLREHTYYACLGFADEPCDYRSTFVVEGQRWKALPPKLTRSRVLRDKTGQFASSANTLHPQTPPADKPGG